MNENTPIVNASDLSMVPDAALNTNQLGLIMKHTPTKYVRKRPAKGGGEWEYVTGGYVKKCLNIMFGFNWSFNILEQLITHGEAVVKGRLTIHTNGHTIVKEQFGNKEIICKRGTDTPLSIGNDLKAAATDALKKCAAEIGIAADIYNKEEFKEVIVAEPDHLKAEIKAILDTGEVKGELRKEAESAIMHNDSAKFAQILRRLKARKQ